MKLEDIYYFQQCRADILELARAVVELAYKNAADKAELERRLEQLATVPEPNGEQRRKAVDFLCELIAFKKLNDLGIKPHWVPAARTPMPDIKYKTDDRQRPVEVKHLNPPRDEDIAYSTTGTFGGFVDPNYHLGLQKKIEDFVNDARNKFANFNKLVNSANDTAGTLCIIFSKSTDAWLNDGIEWESKMLDRVRAMAYAAADKSIKVEILDLQSCFDSK